CLCYVLDTSDFSSSCSADRALHSFPTRRSSDLCVMSKRPTASLSRRHGRSRTIHSQPLRNGPRKLTTRPMPTSEPALRQWDIVVDRKSTRLNSSHVKNSYAVFCLKKKKDTNTEN